MGYHEEIDKSIGQVKEWPVTSDNVLTMAALLYIKEHCSRHERREWSGDEGGRAQHFDRKTAEEWTSRMKNADGTSGPHFSMEKAQEIMKQHGVDYDPVQFWAALNASYSDVVGVFKKHNINTLEAYVDYTIAFWFEDKDAVDDKLAAYYANVVKH